MPYIWNILYIFALKIKHLTYENIEIHTNPK